MSRERFDFRVWEQGTGELTDGVEVEHESPRQAAFEAASELAIGFREALLCVRRIGDASEDTLVFRVKPHAWYSASVEPVITADDVPVTA